MWSRCGTCGRSSVCGNCSMRIPRRLDPMATSRAVPDSISVTDGIIAEIVEDLAERLRSDPAADVESFLREHAEFGERLRPLLPAVVMMAELGRSEAAGVGLSSSASDDQPASGGHDQSSSKG